MTEQPDSIERHPDYMPEAGYLPEDEGDAEDAAPEPAEGDAEDDEGAAADVADDEI